MKCKSDAFSGAWLPTAGGDSSFECTRIQTEPSLKVAWRCESSWHVTALQCAQAWIDTSYHGLKILDINAELSVHDCNAGGRLHPNDTRLPGGVNSFTTWAQTASSLHGTRHTTPSSDEVVANSGQKRVWLQNLSEFAAFFLQVLKWCTDLNQTLLCILISGTYTKCVWKNKILALGICFPQPSSSAGCMFAASKSRLQYYRRIVSFPQEQI